MHTLLKFLTNWRRSVDWKQCQRDLISSTPPGSLDLLTEHEDQEWLDINMVPSAGDAAAPLPEMNGCHTELIPTDYNCNNPRQQVDCHIALHADLIKPQLPDPLTDLDGLTQLFTECVDNRDSGEENASVISNRVYNGINSTKAHSGTKTLAVNPQDSFDNLRHGGTILKDRIDLEDRAVGGVPGYTAECNSLEQHIDTLDDSSLGVGLKSDLELDCDSVLRTPLAIIGMQEPRSCSSSSTLDCGITATSSDHASISPPNSADASNLQVWKQTPPTGTQASEPGAFTSLISRGIRKLLEFMSPLVNATWAGVRKCAITIFSKTCNLTGGMISGGYRFTKSEQAWDIIEKVSVLGARMVKWLLTTGLVVTVTLCKVLLAVYSFYLVDCKTKRPPRTTTEAPQLPQKNCPCPSQHDPLQPTEMTRPRSSLQSVHGIIRKGYHYLISDEWWPSLENLIRSWVQFNKTGYAWICTLLEQGSSPRVPAVQPHSGVERSYKLGPYTCL